MPVTNFQSVVSAQSLGSADVQAMAGAFGQLATAIDGATQKATKVNEHPGFSSFAEKVKQGIQDPLGAAGNAAESFLKTLGPMGVAAAGTVTVLGAVGVAALGAMKSLGDYGHEIEDAGIRTGLTTREVGQFSFAAKMAGQDIGIFEAGMRKLSQGISGGDRNVLDGLKNLRVNFREANGELKPTSDIFLQISEGLQRMQSPFERNATAIQIFGRQGAALVPVLVELTGNVERAKALGLGASEEDLRRWKEYHKQIVEITTQWDKLKRDVAEPLAAVLNVTLKFAGGIPKALSLLELPGQLALSEGRTADDAEMGQTGGWGYGASMSISGHRAQIRLIQRNDAAVSARLQGTDEERLKSARAELSTLAEKLVTGIDYSPEKFSAYDKQKAIVDAIEARIKATRDLEASERSLDAWEKQVSQKAVGPVAAAFLKRDEYPVSLRGRATDSALIEASGALSKENAEQQKREFETALKTGEMAAKAWEEVYKVTDKAGSQALKDFMEAARAAVEANREIDSIQLGSERSEIMARSRRATGLSELAMTGPGQEVQAAAAGYQERLRLAQELYDLDVERAEKETDWNKARVDQARAEADLHKEMYEADIEWELKIAELQRRRIDELRNQAGSLFDSLLQGPKGLQDFAKNFMLGQVRTIFQNMAVEMFKGVSAHMGIPGKIFQGTIFGQDPLKGATDLNTVATNLNTEALRQVSAALAAARTVAMSPAGGGGGFSSAASTFAGMLSGGRTRAGEQLGLGALDAAGLTRNSAGLLVRGPEAPQDYAYREMPLTHTSAMDPALLYPELSNPGTATAKGGLTLGKGVGYGMAIGAGAFGIYSGIRQGGAQGALTAVGSALGTAAVLDPEPVSKAILAVAAFATGLATSVFGDPKAKRAAEMDSWLKGHQFSGPDPVSIVKDTYGRDLSYDVRGNMRPVVVNNYNTTTNQISAIDTQSFDVYLQRNAQALNRGVARAIDDGGELVPKMASALGLQ